MRRATGLIICRGALGALLLALGAHQARAQGCAPIRHMAPSLSAEGIFYLEPNEWEATVSYRYLHSEHIFIEDSEQPQLAQRAARLDIHSWDLSLNYAVTRRWSLNFVMPFIHAEASSVRDHTDGQRHMTTAGGLGDVRLLANYWLLDPAKHPNGNILAGLGFKAPTGNDCAVDKLYTPTGVEIRPVDISEQPGDGGWGIVAEFQAYQLLLPKTFGYASGYYLSNPRDQNNTTTRLPTTGPFAAGPDEHFNSVPDQYQARLGLSYAIWPAKGIALSLGGRIDGLPVHDLIGGDLGFRRPGYTVYLEPGINWIHGPWFASISGPVALYRNRPASVPEQERGINRGGGFADFLILASVSRRF